MADAAGGGPPPSPNNNNNAKRVAEDVPAADPGETGAAGATAAAPKKKKTVVHPTPTKAEKQAANKLKKAAKGTASTRSMFARVKKPSGAAAAAASGGTAANVNAAAAASGGTAANVNAAAPPPSSAAAGTGGPVAGLAPPLGTAVAPFGGFMPSSGAAGLAPSSGVGAVPFGIFAPPSSGAPGLAPSPSGAAALLAGASPSLPVLHAAPTPAQEGAVPSALDLERDSAAEKVDGFLAAAAERAAAPWAPKKKQPLAPADLTAAAAKLPDGHPWLSPQVKEAIATAAEEAEADARSAAVESVRLLRAHDFGLSGMAVREAEREAEREASRANGGQDPRLYMPSGLLVVMAYAQQESTARAFGCVRVLGRQLRMSPGWEDHVRWFFGGELDAGVAQAARDSLACQRITVANLAHELLTAAVKASYPEWSRAAWAEVHARCYCSITAAASASAVTSFGADSPFTVAVAAEAANAKDAHARTEAALARFLPDEYVTEEMRGWPADRPIWEPPPQQMSAQRQGARAAEWPGLPRGVTPGRVKGPFSGYIPLPNDPDVLITGTDAVGVGRQRDQSLLAVYGTAAATLMDAKPWRVRLGFGPDGVRQLPRPVKESVIKHAPVFSALYARRALLELMPPSSAAGGEAAAAAGPDESVPMEEGDGAAGAAEGEAAAAAAAGPSEVTASAPAASAGTYALYVPAEDDAALDRRLRELALH